MVAAVLYDAVVLFDGGVSPTIRSGGSSATRAAPQAHRWLPVEASAALGDLLHAGVTDPDAAEANPPLGTEW